MSKDLHASYRGNVIKYTEDDYNHLKNIPSINGKKLQGSMIWSDLGLRQAIDEAIDANTLAESVLQEFAATVQNAVTTFQTQLNDLILGMGATEHYTLLWEGTGNYKDQDIDLSEAPEEFDEIIVFASGELHHYPVDLFCNYNEGIRLKKTTLHTHTFPADPADVSVAELNIRPKYNHATCSDAEKLEFTIRHNWVWKWSGKAAETGKQDTFLDDSDPTYDEVNVYQIVGVKYNVDGETIDGRITFDGQTLETIGDAIRYQAQHAVPADGSVTMAKFSQQVQQYMNYVSLRLDDHGGFIDALWGAVNELDRRVTALENNNS